MPVVKNFIQLSQNRALKMVEVVSARLQDVYQKWESRSEPQMVSYTGLRRYGYEHRQKKRMLAREVSGESTSGALLDIKEEPWQLDVNKDSRPFMGLCCSQCTSSSRSQCSEDMMWRGFIEQPRPNTAVAKAQQELWLHNVLAVDTEPHSSFFRRKFCHLSSVWQYKKYDYPQLASTVLQDERLHQAVQMAAKQDCGQLREESEEYMGLVRRHEDRATKTLYDMRSTLSDFLLRMMAWLVYKLMPCFLTSVLAHPSQIEMVKKASSTGLPLIFLPLHRSHLDYIIVTFMLLSHNIRSPLVAAGDNLRIPFFGWLLRRLGAFFIKRRMDPVQGRRDIVYRAVLQTYMLQCLRAGHNVEFFIEGGRTRTGKACLPKAGLLSVIVDAYTDGTIEDALLVPVSVNYEKLVDGNFVREQLGQPKQMETFGTAIKSIWSVLNSNYGMMRVDFNQPFSLRELVCSFHALNKDKPRRSPDKKTLHTVPSSASLYGTDIVAEEQRQLVDSIARHIVHDCTQATAVMSTNAVAFLLLNKFRNGITLDKLVIAVDNLKKDLYYAGRDIGFTGETVDVINHACELLGPGLVRRERVCKPGEKPSIMIRPFIIVPNVIELSYYSNMLLSHYVLDSVVATSLCSLLNEEQEKHMAGNYQLLTFSTEAVQQRALELCEVLQFEFVFTKPCKQLETAIEEAIAQLKYKEILVINEPTYTEDQLWSRRYAKNFDEDSESGEDGEYLERQALMLDTRPEARETLEFYHGLLRPLVETYTVSALGLQHLVDRQLTERDLVQELLREMRTQLKRGFAQFEESLSVDAFRNSLKLFERWDVLECITHDRIKLYYLSEEFDDDKSVQTVFEKVKRFSASH